MTIKKLAAAALIAATLTTPAIAEPVFVLAQTTITDVDTYFNEYGPLAFASLEKYGAEVTFASQDYTTVEGDWDGNWTVVLSFPSEFLANEWYNSEDYSGNAKPIRLTASEDGRLVIFRQVAQE